jgi:hypothetical protein
MLPFNWPVILAVCLIPLLVGAIYYHKNVFGGLLARIENRSNEAKNGHSPMIYVFSLLLGVLLAVFMIPVVFHANHVFSLISQPGGGPPDENSEGFKAAQAFINTFGGNFNTFKHGFFHGILTALFGAWPILGIHSMFEGKKWKYVALHLGYWVLVLGLMGGLINAFGLK